MNNEVTFIVACDHGNRFIKFSEGEYHYEAGYVVSEKEPISRTDLLLYEGRYYSIGQSRLPVQKDKTLTEDYFILTLPGIANSMKLHGLGNNASVILSAGLPISTFSAQKERFRSYFVRTGIRFQFNGDKYQVNIKDCKVFPQCYAAIMPRFQELRKLSQAILVDVGSYTVDVVVVENGMLNLSMCFSIDAGCILLAQRIIDEIMRTKGISLTEKQVEDIIIQKSPLFIQDDIKSTVSEITNRYVYQLLGLIKERGVEIKANPMFVFGGGALLLQRYFDLNNGLLGYYEINKDFSNFANVKGFEYLTKEQLRREGIFHD